MNHLIFDSFADQIKNNKIVLAVFGTDSFDDPLKDKLGNLSSSIHYVFISPKNAKRLEKRLAIKSLPAIRIYFGDLELFSNFNLPIKHMKKINPEFEVADFLIRILKKSIISETTQQKQLYKAMRVAFKMNPGFLVFILDSKLPFCDLRSYSRFMSNSQEPLPPLSVQSKKRFVKNIQQVYITVSRVMSPLPSFFIRNHLQFVGELGQAFSGVDLSASFLQSSPFKSHYHEQVSNQMRSLDFSNLETINSLDLCQGLFLFHNKTKAFHPISLFDLIISPEDLISSSLRVKNLLKNHLSRAIPRFPYSDYRGLFHNPSDQFLFVNQDFMSQMMQKPVQQSLEQKFKKLAKTNISSNLTPNNRRRVLLRPKRFSSHKLHFVNRDWQRPRFSFLPLHASHRVNFVVICSLPPLVRSTGKFKLDQRRRNDEPTGAQHQH